MLRREDLDVVGLVPMAGFGARLAPLPFSKELFPLLPRSDEPGTPVDVISRHVLAQVLATGASRAFLVIRHGKWDIPGYYRDGSARAGLALAYLLARQPYGLPFSLDTARPFTRGAIVAMGLPDVLLRPPDALARTVQRYRDTDADLVMALFPWSPPPANDLLEVDPSGRVVAYHTANPPPHARLAWGALVWGDMFSDFMGEQTQAWETNRRPNSGEMMIAAVLASAIETGLIVQSVGFSGGSMLDIGSPLGLSRLAGWTSQGDVSDKPSVSTPRTDAP